MDEEKKKVLAIASAGGHWVQLLRLQPAFTGCEVIYASTVAGNAVEVEGYEFHHLANATRKTFWNFFVIFFQCIRIIRKVRPNIIVTTGSAPGLIALAVGRLFKTRNVWIDSIANVDQLSTSGKQARFVADLHLTQWETLAKSGGPTYKGSVL